MRLTLDTERKTETQAMMLKPSKGFRPSAPFSMHTSRSVARYPAATGMTVRTPPTTKDLNLEFLKSAPKKYAGEWVLLLDGKPIGSGKTMVDALQRSETSRHSSNGNLMMCYVPTASERRKKRVAELLW